MAYFALFFILSFGSLSHGQAPAPNDAAPFKLRFEDLMALEESLRNVVETQQVANLSFGVWKDNQLVRAGFYGPVNEDNSETVSDDTIHRIYSMTKPVTAIGLLILMERGAFRLDDPITKLLPEFETTEVLADTDPDGTFYTYRQPRPPTMAQLLSHTAGLAYGEECQAPSIKSSPNFERTMLQIQRPSSKSYRLCPTNLHRGLNGTTPSLRIYRAL